MPRNSIIKSRFTIGIVIGVVLMLGLIKIIPDQIFIFILPVIGGFAAGIVSSNVSITTINTNNEYKELNAGEAVGIIFGIIICFVGTLLFEWTYLTDMAYLLLSPYEENSHLFSLLFIAFILILSHFYWKTILILSLITVCLCVPPPYPLFNIIYDATFTILLLNTYVMGVICGVLGSSGNKLSKVFLDCLQNLYYTIANADFAKRVQHILSDKYIRSSISIIFVVVIIVSIATFAPYSTEQKEKRGVLPLKVTNVEINTPEIEYYSISPLKKYATEIALEDYPNVDRGRIINLIGKSASLTTANLDITLSIYNPNNKTIKLDKIDYTLYEINPLRRYIKRGASTEKSITLPPHTTTPVFLNSKLDILQSGILRFDAIMFYYSGVSNYRTWDSEKYPIKLKVKGILYSENSTDSFKYDINTSVAEILQFNFAPKKVIETNTSNRECIITPTDWENSGEKCGGDIFLIKGEGNNFAKECVLTPKNWEIPEENKLWTRVEHKILVGRLGEVPIDSHGYGSLDGREFHFDNGVKESLDFWSRNCTVYCDENDTIHEDPLIQKYGLPKDIIIKINGDKLLPIKDVEKATNMSLSQIRPYIKDGRIEVIEIGASWWIKNSTLDKIMEIDF